MYIYSVTIRLQKQSEQEWLDFMQKKHMRDVLDTGYFEKANMRKIVSEPDADMIIYNIEYHTDHMEKYNDYARLAAPALQKDVSDRFAGKFTAERVVYEEVISMI
jgi:hypothetical protein